MTDTISLSQFEPQNPSQDVYAQALDGSNQEMYSPTQSYHDDLDSQISPVIQTGSTAPPPQFADLFSFFQPQPENPWFKYSIFFGLGFLVFKFLRRK